MAMSRFPNLALPLLLRHKSAITMFSPRICSRTVEISDEFVFATKVLFFFRSTNEENVIVEDFIAVIAMAAVVLEMKADPSAAIGWNE